MPPVAVARKRQSGLSPSIDRYSGGSDCLAHFLDGFLYGVCGVST